VRHTAFKPNHRRLKPMTILDPQTLLKLIKSLLLSILILLQILQFNHQKLTIRVSITAHFEIIPGAETACYETLVFFDVVDSALR